MAVLVLHADLVVMDFNHGIADAGLAGRERGCGKAVMQHEAGA